MLSLLLRQNQHLFFLVVLLVFHASILPFLVLTLRMECSSSSVLIQRRAESAVFLYPSWPSCMLEDPVSVNTTAIPEKVFFQNQSRQEDRHHLWYHFEAQFQDEDIEVSSVWSSIPIRYTTSNLKQILHNLIISDHFGFSFQKTVCTFYATLYASSTPKQDHEGNKRQLHLLFYAKCFISQEMTWITDRDFKKTIPSFPVVFFLNLMTRDEMVSQWNNSSDCESNSRRIFLKKKSKSSWLWFPVTDTTSSLALSVKLEWPKWTESWSDEHKNVRETNSTRQASLWNRV